MRWLFALWLLLAPATAFAQAAAGTPNQPVFPQTANRGAVQFLEGTDTAGTYKTLYTAGAKGSICKALWMQNSDTATHLVTVQIVNTAVKYGGPTPTTTVAAGTIAILGPPVGLMAAAVWPGLPLDQNGDPYLYLINGDTLQATFATALTATAGTVIDLIAICSDF